MHSEIDRFREFIVGEKDYSLGQPATEQEIAEFEARYAVHLPANVREYFLKINGVYLNGGFITIGALSEWCLITDYGYDLDYINKNLPNADKYFRFGGYDISVWNWLIKLSDNPNEEFQVYVFYEKLTRIADSFTDFLYRFRTEESEDLLGY